MKGAKKDASGHLRIPLQSQNLKIVYQISEDKEKKGINKGLFYAKKLLDTYNANGIADKAVDLHLVFHGEGTNALVDAPTRKLLGLQTTTNPNSTAIEALLKRGVSIELCESSMKQRNVLSKELIDGVATVIGAYPRIIDLQQLGYSYIKFE